MLTSVLAVFYVIVGYLVGSVCSAVIVCRLFSLPDPRTAGSNNPGATNVLRIAGPKCAIIVLVADMLKGFLPVFLAKLLGANTASLSFICLAAVLGHMFPIFFKFKGGKGVATALGAFLGFDWLLGAMVLATWLVVALITRYSSLASLVAIAFSPFYSLYVVNDMSAFLPLVLIVMAVFYKHHGNILRLTDGTEPKMKLKRESS